MTHEKEQDIVDKCECILGDLNTIMGEIAFLIDGLKRSGEGSLGDFVRKLEGQGSCGDLINAIRTDKQRLDSIIRELDI